MDKLYHLVLGEWNIDPNRPVFPYIPHYTMLGEDQTIPRICTSTSLDGCLAGIGLPRIQKKGLEWNIWGEEVFLPFTVLVFDVDWEDPCILSTCEVAEYVPDAFESDECWILNPMTPAEVKHMWLVGGRVMDASAYAGARICNSVWSKSPMPMLQWFAEDLGLVADDSLWGCICG